MKRWLILIALLMSSLAWAGSTTVVVGQAAAGGLTCTDGSGDSALLTQNTGTADSAITDTKWKYQQFQFSVTTRITSIEIYHNSASGTGNVIMSIYTDDGDDHPSAEVSGTSVTRAASGLSYGAMNKYSLSTPWTATANTKYHFVLRCTGTTPLEYWAVDTSGTNPYTGGTSGYSSDSGSTWIDNADDGGSGYDRRFIINGCQ